MAANIEKCKVTINWYARYARRMTDPVVKIKAGLIHGVIKNHEDGFKYYAFRGIPYAEPPVGELRFQDSIPKKRWTGILDCKKYSSKGFQYDVFPQDESYDEDSLYLNVFTRSINEKNVKRPVMVYVHGGDFSFGGANDTYCGPDYLIRKEIVFVTINFRLGIMGFLDLEDEIAPGNQGLKDQVMTLQWIQQNIRVFNGDPNNVTIYGLSSGGVSAHLLALSPLAKGLLHKIICSSDVIYNPRCMPINPKSNTIKLCSLLGKDLTDSKEILAFLKTVDSRKLLEAQRQLRKYVDYTPYGPGVDSKSPYPFMPIPPITAADQGIQIPSLVGYNSHEGIVALIGISRKDFFESADKDFIKILIFNGISIANRHKISPEQLRRLYYKSKKVSEDNLEKFVELVTDFYFKEGMHKYVRVQSERSSASTYLYQFSYHSPNNISQNVVEDVPGGIGHLDESAYLINATVLPKLGIDHHKKGSNDYKIMEQMTEMWTNFATYGRPTLDVTKLIPLHWKPISDGTLVRYLNIDEDLTMRTEVNFDKILSRARDIKV